MNKTTPINCKLCHCSWNRLPPPENSQECVGCEGNRDPRYRPTGRRKKS
ncbi:hypothetical protein ES705_19566 [subsurface metagenome]